jgi:predicted permease
MRWIRILSEFFAVITQNILPIAIVAAFGFGLQRWLQLDKRVLSSAVFNCLSPCLVFSSLVNSALPYGELVELAAFAAVTILAMGVIAYAVGRALRLERGKLIALMLLVMFVNGGNFGLTLVQLRYGQDGLSRAIVYYTVSTLLVYSLGIMLASSRDSRPQDALVGVVRFPAFYAAIAAVAVYGLGLSIPSPLMTAIELAGSGAIPVMLLVLGMQLADLSGPLDWRLATPALLLRLIVGPIIGVAVAAAIGLQGLARSTAITESSMPPAVMYTILATEFSLDAPLVTAIVVIATLVSPLTIAASITVLGL